MIGDLHIFVIENIYKTREEFTKRKKGNKLEFKRLIGDKKIFPFITIRKIEIFDPQVYVDEILTIIKRLIYATYSPEEVDDNVYADELVVDFYFKLKEFDMHVVKSFTKLLEKELEEEL